ncbi:RHS repeat-associated core domain-containing protein [Pseudomonas sp. zfem004]|uniref:RHS repeat-associated core domain-containing protein n=1 Tax=Pseudomonas sp. zfem004 TaxID=3078199 RepID=UPI00292932E0|nr:RHS repeat-associated core domain-containing protein [Pseudomonas sp. zfem004]MDU9401376.1 RHS repeat-associated core domain-containing protein [Pseudomonas sp. zfem004]
MHKNAKSTLLFHQGRALKTVKKGLRTITLLGTPEQPLAEHEPASQAVAQKLLASDQQGSVVNVHASVVLPPTSYAAYGYCTPQYQPHSTLAYNGERVDVFGWYLLGSYRILNTAIMRFHSPDSFSPFGAGGINAYAYCGNNPVLNTDPTGHVVPTAILQHPAQKLLLPVLSGKRVKVMTIGTQKKYVPAPPLSEGDIASVQDLVSLTTETIKTLRARNQGLNNILKPFNSSKDKLKRLDLEHQHSLKPNSDRGEKAQQKKLREQYSEHLIQHNEISANTLKYCEEQETIATDLTYLNKLNEFARANIN